MPRKIDLITEMYRQTVKDLAGNPANWISFLNTAASNYKYNFDDQVLINAQHPHATACAEIEFWNSRMGRWVNKGAHGIALTRDNGGHLSLHYIFDVSDTNSRDGNEIRLWKMDSHYESDVIEALEARFGDLSEKGTLEQAIVSAADNAVDDNMTDYLQEIISVREGSFLEDLDVMNIQVLTKQLLVNSVAYMMMTRCGLDTDGYFDLDDFREIFNFNTLDSMTRLGAASSDIAEMGLREIEQTIKNLQISERKQNRTFAKSPVTEYPETTEKVKERTENHHDNSIQDTGRLSDSRADASGAAEGDARQVRNAAQEISDEPQEGAVSEPESNGQADRTSGGNRANGSVADRQPDFADEEVAGRDRTDESDRSDALGGADEQHSERSGGNSAERPDLQLNFPSVNEQLTAIEEAEADKNASAFVISQEVIDEILTRGSGFSEGKMRIFEQFQKKLMPDKNAAFLKNEYGIGGSYPVATLNNVSLSQDHDAKGIRITTGSLSKPDAKKLLSWSQVARRIGELITADRYLSEAEKEAYPKYQRDRELRAQRSVISDEFESIVDDFNDFETQLGNETVCYNGYYMSSAARAFACGEKKYHTRTADGDFALPAMREALSGIIAQHTHLTERAEKVLEQLNGEIARPLEPTFDELNPPPESLKEYRFSLGDTVHIGIDKYEILSLGDTVRLFDESFPLFNKEMTRAEFDEKVAENPLNDKYLHIIDDVPEMVQDDDRSEMPWDYGKHFDDEEDGIPVYDRESDILYDILSALKIDDIELDFDGEGIVASDADNIWHGAEFYRFLVDEAIVWNDDGSALGINQELLYDFMELSEYNGVPVNKKKDLSPWEEYSKIKERNPDCIVVYQVGDFFEIMGVDADSVSPDLELVLGQRSVEFGKQVPMIGFPSFNLEKNVEKLRSIGFDVLIAPLENGKRNEYIFPSTKPPEQTVETNIGNIPIEDFREIKAGQYGFDSYEDMRRQGFRLGDGNDTDDKQPIRVSIPFSEHPAFYSREKNEDGNIQFVDRYTEMSFAAANALLGQLDMKQNAERDSKNIGWYHKTDFVIHYTVNGTNRTYEGRYDLGDGETDLLTHISKAIDYFEKFNEKGQNPEHAEEWKELRETLLPLLAADTELTAEDKALVAEIMATEPQWYPETESVQQSLADEELDELPVSAVIDGEVKTFPNAVALEEAMDAPAMAPPTKRNREKAAPHVLLPEILSADRTNFRITEDSIGIGTPNERYNHNIMAIKLLQKLEDEHRLANADEQKVLSQYVGWGGLSDCFDEKSSHYQELKSLLSEEEYAAARESTLTAFYTPPTVIRAMYKALENMNFCTGNILEPSCGVGNFLGMVPNNMAGSKMYGVELDDISGRIAQQLYQNSSIAVQGYEKTELPDSFFDCAIGNVPFGQFKVPDKRYDKHNFLIHDYFFARTLDKVRPGGIIAFITSKGTLDKENPSVRKYIAQRADLLGAIRLPNNTFRDAAGTDVTSDIIFLQKRDRMVDIEPEWVHLGKDENGITMNSYFVEHPDMIMGEVKLVSGRFGMEPACIAYEGQNLSEQLSEAIQSIHAEITEYEASELAEDEEDLSVPADPSVRNFSFTVVDGKVYYRENSRMNPVDVSVTAENRIRGLVEIRDCVRTLIEYQSEDYPDDDIKAQQEKLNSLYDVFSKKYGIINSRGNNTAFSEDSSYCLLCSLEVLDDEGNFVRKADMFNKRTIKQKTIVTSVDTASEALAISLAEHVKVDMPFMMQLCNKTEEEIVCDLQGVIFLNPLYEYGSSNFEKYLPADEYLSGNVREKLSIARRSAELYPDDYTVNVKALEEVQPKDLTASEIAVRLGATWLPPGIVKDFMFELLDTPRYCQWKIDVHYSSITGEWNIENKSYDRSSIKSYSTYGTDRINAYRIIEETLNLRDVRIFDYIEDENGKRVPVLNKKETAIAQGKQELIKAAFADWIWDDPSRREKLCRLYNDKFNSNRVREYDGSHLNFVGINPEITLRKHQVDAIAHIIYGGNTLLAHVVGAGKTFEMVAAAQESKRLGLCQKSLFVVPNHLTEQWASEYLQLYPSANILVATRKDFETKNRKKFCGRIATGDYDAIIIGHTQFEKIPMSVDRQRIILEQQMSDIIDGIAEAKANAGNNFTVKQLEKTRKSVQQKLDKLNDQTRKDDVVTFEELGVDRVFIDEAHYYKNLAAFSKMRNVAGISQTEAQKSSDLYMKCRYLDEITGGRGIIFATGTPISNSMVELYTMQKYLQYNTLKRNNLIHFDAWASTFGETVTAIELAPEGTGYRAKTRFARFYNLPELMMMFREVADVQTADMLNLPVPQANRHNIILKPTEHQKNMVASLADRAERVRNKMVDSTEDNMLLITNDGRKLALDQRLINDMLPDDESSKCAACANNAFSIWELTKEQHSTQMIFCDLSTPHNDGKFNVYDDIRDKLIARGVPAEEIAYIHTADSEAKKKELFGKVRSGQIRILLGSTQKMGAGTNVQKKLVALSHVDCPWRPSDVGQTLRTLAIYDCVA